MLYRLIILAGFLLCAKGQMRPSESYTHSATLKSGNIKLYWKFNDTDITFEVMGQTTGWIGIGFSPNGAMTSSDLFAGWVKNGMVKVTDRHASANTFPPLDPQQDIVVLGGEECDGWTMFKFSRSIAACEEEYDREITSDTQRLIWAYGDSDPVGDDLVLSDDYHGTKRGAESLYFLQSPETPTDLPVGPTYETFDILVSEFALPAEDTYYNCKLFKLPTFSKKHHVVKFEPVVQEGNELYVHHMLLYRCGDVLQNDTELGLDARCYTPNMAHFPTCTVIIAMWAIGGGDMIYPYEVGFSVGGENDPTYVLLETHYDNPRLESDVVDNSGLRFTYTSTLRQYDIGVLETGAAIYGPDHFIPPGAESFTSIGHCTPECMENRMTASGVENITVFSVALHSHLAGRALRLRHIRGGVELPYLAADDSYDFNYQDTRTVHPPVVVKNTDHLQMECVYNTQDRDIVTEAGLGTKQEMCLAFVFYYPRLDWGYCLSSVSHHGVWPEFGINMKDVKKTGENVDSMTSYTLTAPPEVAGQTVLEYMSNIGWTEEIIENFEKEYNAAQHYQVCTQVNRSKVTITDFDVMDITVPYEVPRKTCSETRAKLSETPETKEVCSEVTTSPSSEETTSGSPALKICLNACIIALLCGFIMNF